MFNNKKVIIVMAAIMCSFFTFSSVAQDQALAKVDIKEAFFKELKLLDGLQVYNKQLQWQIEAQKISANKLREGIVNSTNLEREMVPLLKKMLTELTSVINKDIPFEKNVRAKSLANLERNLLVPEVLLSEKFRQLFSIIAIENEYGRSNKAYEGVEEIDGKSLNVDYLRVGRLGYYYITKDGDTSAMWNKSTSQWEVLPSEYNRHIAHGVRVASKSIAPELINLPLVVAPEGL